LSFLAVALSRLRLTPLPSTCSMVSLPNAPSVLALWRRTLSGFFPVGFLPVFPAM
jgi:hypothetical protein